MERSFQQPCNQCDFALALTYMYAVSSAFESLCRVNAKLAGEHSGDGQPAAEFPSKTSTLALCLIAHEQTYRRTITHNCDYCPIDVQVNFVGKTLNGGNLEGVTCFGKKGTQD